jgi:hypothetical protein
MLKFSLAFVRNVGYTYVYFYYISGYQLPT